MAIQVTSLLPQGEASICTEKLLTHRTCLHTVSKVSFVLALGFAVTTALLSTLFTVSTPIALIVFASLTIGFVMVSAMLVLLLKFFCPGSQKALEHQEEKTEPFQE